MKTIVTALFLLTLSISVPAVAYKPIISAAERIGNDSITLDYLVGMDKKQFKGKTIAELLASEEAKGYTDLSFRYTPEGVLQGLKIKYSNQLFLTVYVTEFKHLKPHSLKRQWDLEALKKEAIDEIRVLYVMYD
ncbi:hypothetical protein D770_03340 [Flammeovirgaceae bacterium 311]|nr:hypothetical protein D770_03340 [Flammeovirgaceae bacterium 311]